MGGQPLPSEASAYLEPARGFVNRQPLTKLTKLTTPGRTFSPCPYYDPYYVLRCMHRDLGPSLGILCHDLNIVRRFYFYIVRIRVYIHIRATCFALSAGAAEGEVSRR